MVAQRSESMDALRRNGFQVWAGMTIFWIGDEDHQDSASGHNPDDTAGVQAELSDKDSLQEVRALDFMIGPNFSSIDATRLVSALRSSSSKPRLYYIIYRDRIYRRATGFASEHYSGTFHGDHVHVSGWNGDDSNGADWPSVLALEPAGGGDDMEQEEFNGLMDGYINARTGGSQGTSATQRTMRARARQWIAGTAEVDDPATVDEQEDASVDKRLNELDAKVDQILTTGGGSPDVAAIIAAINNQTAVLQADLTAQLAVLRGQVREDTDAELDEAFSGGADSDT